MMSTTAKTATTNQLCNAVTEMDRVAQGAFSEIATIAKLALASLETPESHSDIESMATVLTLILDKAAGAEDHINSLAENVGYNYKDPAERRRSDARRKARETALSEVTA